MEIKNILFDFNGTIVDDLNLCLELLNTMLLSCGHKRVNLDEYLEIFDFPVIEYYKKAGFIFPKDDFSTLAKYFIKEYSSRTQECPLHEGVIETLEYFKNKGLKLYIVSASEISLLKSQLKMYGIDGYFDGISGLDNINASSKIESAKAFMKKIHINKNETIFVGDTLHDAEVGDELEVRSILIAKGHQSKRRLQTSGRMVIDSFNELKDVIKRVGD